MLMDKALSPLPGQRQILSLLEKSAFPAPDQKPRIGIIAGSGMSRIGDIMESGVQLEFEEIDGLGSAQVAGHAGHWAIGSMAGVPIHFVAGRRHYYEGASSGEVIHATRLLSALGVRLLILTNAAGGLTDPLRPGDIMMLGDLINLSFRNSLVGPHDDPAASRLPSLADAFDPAARAIVRKRTQAAGIPLREGVYAQVLGPNYETRSEIEMLRRLGADAVGMSTVPEVLAARQAGMRVVAFSLVTNIGLGRGGVRRITSHGEVLEAADVGCAKMISMFETILPPLQRLSGSPAYSNR